MVYKYSVKWDFDGKIKLEEGLVFATHYADATTRTMNLFGEDEVLSLTLSCISENIDLVSFDAILNALKPIECEESSLGPQLYEALAEAMEVG